MSTGAEDAPAEPAPADAAGSGEARLLQELFAGAEGFHSALDHSAVEEAGGAARRDVERLAAAVAKQAAAAVAASHAARQQAGVHMCAPPAVPRSDACPSGFGRTRPSVLSAPRSAAFGRGGRCHVR